MKELILLLIAFLLLAFISGSFSFWVWRFMGQPRIEFNEALADKGQILSSLGLWVCKRFNAYEAKSAEAKTKKKTKALEGLELGSEQYLKADNYFEQDYTNLNPYKALGACLVCFATHLNNFQGIAYGLIYWLVFGQFWGFIFFLFMFWHVANIFTLKLSNNG